MSDGHNNLSDIDRFWDLDSLLPRKRSVSVTPRQTNTEAVEIEFGSAAQVSHNCTAVPKRDQSASANRSGTPARYSDLPIPNRAAEYRSRSLDPYLIYAPQSKLLRRAEVSKWETRFNFYENFISDAKRLWNRTTTECVQVPFFSYVPQYSQLKYAQLKWYLWWRENVRKGVYLPTDFCYILLYIYEILNCPELIPPKKGIDVLCDIWLEYRGEHRRIDSYMCEWLCDYCLIFELPCPTEKLEPILSDIIKTASLKEFYMDADSASGAAVLIHSSTYDWRKSRYVTSENIGLFASHIKAAFNKAYREIIAKDGEGLSKEFRTERISYEGALCVYTNKRTVAVEYVSFTRSPKFRFTVSDIIKYSENRIRMALGIRSRLKVENLDSRLRSCIDEYFDVNLPAPKKSRAPKQSELSAEVHAYERLYEPISSGLSLENALKIEESSWSTTELLTSALGDKSDTTEPPKYPEEPRLEPASFNTLESAVYRTQDDSDFSTLISALDKNCTDALRFLADGDYDGIKKAADAAGALADALADKINEAAFDIIGDSIIEPHGTGYRLISDYEGEVTKCLK